MRTVNLDLYGPPSPHPSTAYSGDAYVSSPTGAAICLFAADGIDPLERPWRRSKLASHEDNSVRGDGKSYPHHRSC